MPYDIDVEDVEYLRHGETPLLARLFTPRGTGPFPLVVEIHGGGWCLGSRESDAAMNVALARNGVVVVAVDFRMPPDAVYPASLVDIHYAIRWCKSQADRLHTRPRFVGVLGTSSGGHQAMLISMRPRDPRYAVLALPPGMDPQDATVAFAVLCWPVIDPLSRYLYAQRRQASGEPYPPVLDRVIPLHDRYWGNEEAMTEGNPTLALERGERVFLPDVLYLQGTCDEAHPRDDLDRFVSQYRAAGGLLDLELIVGEAEGFITHCPASSASARAIETISAFLQRSFAAV